MALAVPVIARDVTPGYPSFATVPTVIAVAGLWCDEFSGQRWTIRYGEHRA
jgi:hypothetical protein